MARIAEPLRELAHTIRLESAEDADLLMACADWIDREHEQRMWQCEHEVRRRLCRDVRWAVNLLEDKCSRRQIKKLMEEKHESLDGASRER